jgi:hypothetical protein
MARGHENLIVLTDDQLVIVRQELQRAIGSMKRNHERKPRNYTANRLKRLYNALGAVSDSEQLPKGLVK